jgi:polyketide biosynthesis enoyl-CoA hydratase PksI
MLTPRADSNFVRWSTDDDGVGLIEMVDHAGANALSEKLVSALLWAFEQVHRSQNTKVVVLLGTKQVFSSGADRAMLDEIQEGDLAPSELVLARRVLDLPVPVIGAAEGSAVGGGLALLFACDLIMVADEKRYGANFVSLGITPGMGTTRLLEHALSPARAHELIYSGALVLGSELSQGSGVNASLPSANVRGKALDLAWRIAEAPRRTLSMLKRSLVLPRVRALEEAFTLESLMHETTFSSLNIQAMPGGK